MLPSGECELIFDNDKVVLEQRQDKQYTFPRSTIRTLRLLNHNQIEFELGSRAPVQGSIRFRFDSPVDARTCYSQWNEGITPLETSSRESSGKYSMKLNLQQQEEGKKRKDVIQLNSNFIIRLVPVVPPRPSAYQEYDGQPPRPPPRGISMSIANEN